MIFLDTNVVSELMKTAPSQAVVQWLRSQSRDELFTTSITVAEVGLGIERLPARRRKQTLKTTAMQAFASFPDRILAFDSAAATEYATIVSARERSGAPVDGFDAQIAAACRARRARLATRNVADFRNTGIEIVNPWGGA